MGIENQGPQPENSETTQEKAQADEAAEKGFFAANRELVEGETVEEFGEREGAAEAKNAADEAAERGFFAANRELVEGETVEEFGEREDAAEEKAA